jgi:hypothetical protein
MTGQASAHIVPTRSERCCRRLAAASTVHAYDGGSPSITDGHVIEFGGGSQGDPPRQQSYGRLGAELDSNATSLAHQVPLGRGDAC